MDPRISSFNASKELERNVNAFAEKSKKSLPDDLTKDAQKLINNVASIRELAFKDRDLHNIDRKQFFKIYHELKRLEKTIKDIYEGELPSAENRKTQRSKTEKQEEGKRAPSAEPFDDEDFIVPEDDAIFVHEDSEEEVTTSGSSSRSSPQIDTIEESTEGEEGQLEKPKDRDQFLGPEKS